MPYRRRISLMTLLLVVSAMVVAGGLGYLNHLERDISATRLLVTGLAAAAISSSSVNDDLTTTQVTLRATSTEEESNDQWLSPELGRFLDYDPSLMTGGNYEQRVLFFYAAWDPLGRSLVKELTVNEDQIPPHILILKIDFDSRLSLRKKYGVESENTVVKVNHQGQVVGKQPAADFVKSLLSSVEVDS